VQPLWKKKWSLLKNLNIDLPYDPAIPLLGIDIPKGMGLQACQLDILKIIILEL
jgi:hypothetical protein